MKKNLIKEIDIYEILYPKNNTLFNLVNHMANWVEKRDWQEHPRQLIKRFS